MANSERQDIMVQVASALNAITTTNGYSVTVNHVGQDLPQSWEQVDHSKFPALFYIDADETEEAMTVGASGLMEATLQLIISAYIYDQTDATRATTRTNLIRDIKKALSDHSGLWALIEWCLPTRTVTDKGLIPFYSLFDQEFEIRYNYTRTDGG